MARFKVTYLCDEAYWGSGGKPEPITRETDDLAEALADLLENVCLGFKVSFKAKRRSASPAA